MNLVGPYQTTSSRGLRYVGNRLYGSTETIPPRPRREELVARTGALASEPMWGHLARINGCIFRTASRYFVDAAALFVPLPLTTRMISSPGAVYGKHKLNYTTDTVPVTLAWFDRPQHVFLSESSQIYLELALVQQGVDAVFSIYNSFRKEESDATHLAEFHHIEYEGHVSAEQNVTLAEGCVRALLRALLEEEEEALAFFLTPAQLRSAVECAEAERLFIPLSFSDALDALRRDTGDQRYADFTLASFGAWEEVRLTEIAGGPVAVSGFPLYEVPFYHAEEPGSEPLRAQNTDLIWSGYREIVGAGLRIGDTAELEAKAGAFSLPRDDYAPYLDSRTQKGFRRSAGFGLGWERFVQGVLCLPSILLTVPFPRTDLDVVP